MDDRLKHEIERLTERRVVSARPCGGGCIANAEFVTLDDDAVVFVKSMPGAAGVFTAETRGLALLAAADTSLRIPNVIGHGAGFLVLEAVPTGRPASDFAERLGRGLAELHLATRRNDGRFGLDHDNTLGATPQPNGWCDTWAGFWRARRLRPMLQHVKGRSAELDRLGARLLDRLDDVLAGAAAEPAVLLHGDLWSGNVLTDETGRPVLIDPACYFGHREAEFGMTRLFGNFGNSFERSYAEVFPFASSHDRRIAVYTLHHLLNHLHLFGEGYLGQCVAALRRIVQA